MKKIENHCCNCASPSYPCLGSRCPRKRVEVTYCDFCGCEIEDKYYSNKIDGKDACMSCYEKEDCEE
jgi:hypothetical protein